MQKRTLTCLTGMVLLLAAAVSGCSKAESVREEAPLVRTLTVAAASGEQSANYAGEVRGRYETQLAFQVGGKIVRRNVDTGSVVRTGDVLMEIDPKDIVQTVNISSAQVASAQSQLNLAAVNLERYQKLFAQGAVSRAQLDSYQNAYEVALAAVHQSSAQQTQGTNQLSYSALVADEAGVISSIAAEVGQVVGAGQGVATLVKGEEREIEISIPENRVDEMRKAPALSVSFWALPGVTAEGRLRELSPVADKVSRTYKVRISLPQPPPGINLGMTANVAVFGTAAGPSVYVPVAAIYQTGDTPHVWVVKEGVATLRPVKIDGLGTEKVQVVSGLQPGEVIVTAGVQKLREGQKVRI